VQTPIAAGLYCRMMLSSAVPKWAAPPNTVESSLMLLEAISMGSRKWLMV
jgi:hypothetical protein